MTLESNITRIVLDMFNKGKTMNAIESRVRLLLEKESKPVSVSKALGRDQIDFPVKRYERQ